MSDAITCDVCTASSDWVCRGCYDVVSREENATHERGLAAERERDELRRERDEQIAEAASWRATARDKGSSSRAAAKERDELRAENERLQRLLDHATQSNPGTSVLVMLMNESREAQAEVERLRAALEETEHAMHLRIRAGYDKTIADSWRKKVEEVEDQRNANAREIDKLRAERRQLRARLVECRPWVGVCPLEPNRIQLMQLVRDLADDTLEEVQP